MPIHLYSPSALIFLIGLKYFTGMPVKGKITKCLKPLRQSHINAHCNPYTDIYIPGSTTVTLWF